MECNSNGERQRSIFGMKRKPYLDCYYTGSSNAKEVETAKHLWSKSEEKRLRHTGFLTDSDSKAYNSITELQQYRDHTAAF